MNHELRERLAAAEHARWTKWQQWVHEHCEIGAGSDLIIPAELVARWSRQIATPYEELSETEKESDRKEADVSLAIICAQLLAIAEEFDRDPDCDVDAWSPGRAIRHAADAIAPEPETALQRATREIQESRQRQAYLDMKRIEAARERIVNQPMDPESIAVPRVEYDRLKTLLIAAQAFAVIWRDTMIDAEEDQEARDLFAAVDALASYN
jgi:hypothetical protein